MAIKFDGVGHYEFAGTVGNGFSFPAGDWAMSMWIRIPDGLAPLPGEAGAIESIFHSSRPRAGSDSHSVRIGHTDSTEPRRIRLTYNPNTSPNTFWIAVPTFGTTTGALTTPVLWVVQRKGTTFESYFITKGGSISAPVTVTGSALGIETPFWYLGKSDTATGSYYRHELSEFALCLNTFTSAEIHHMAKGAPINSFVQPQVYYKMHEAEGNLYDFGELQIPAVGHSFSGITTVDHPFSVDLLAWPLGGGVTVINGSADVSFIDANAVIAEVTGEGGIELSGSASLKVVTEDMIFDPYIYGGLDIFGTADVEEEPAIKGNGRLKIYGSALVSSIKPAPFQPNADWFNVSPPPVLPLLYARLDHQVTPFGARDSIVYIEGTPQSEVIPISYDAIYDPVSGICKVVKTDDYNYLLLEVFLGLYVEKIDLTFDLNGKAVIAYSKHNGIWIYHHVSTGYEHQYITDGRTPFICLDDRRDGYTSKSTILLLYNNSGYWLTRKKKEDYKIPRITAWEFARADVEIRSFGMTSEYRMQISAVATKSYEE